MHMATLRQSREKEVQALCSSQIPGTLFERPQQMQQLE
jgi:hypothetical protein